MSDESQKTMAQSTNSTRLLGVVPSGHDAIALYSKTGNTSGGYKKGKEIMFLLLIQMQFVVSIRLKGTIS